MKPRVGRILAWGLLAGTLAACTSGSGTTGATVTSSSATDPPSTFVQDVWAGEPFTELEPGTYFIDPDGDPSTPLRVTYEVPTEGWQSWIGATKFGEATACSSDGCRGLPSHVNVSITTVSNLVRHGCRDHSWADPSVGPSVDDLATALAELPPFRVTSPPKDVTIDGYSGEHLELTVPDLPVEGDPGNDRRFRGCEEGKLKSWVAFIDTADEGDAWYGYTGPGYREEYWILDVDGTRLVIVAGRSPGSPAEDLEELLAILGSIQVQP